MRPWPPGDVRRYAFHCGALLMLLIAALTFASSAVGGRFHAVAVLGFAALLLPIGTFEVTRSAERTAIACAVGGASIAAIVTVAIFALRTSVGPWRTSYETVAGGVIGALAFGFVLLVMLLSLGELGPLRADAKSRALVAFAGVGTFVSVGILAAAASSVVFDHRADPNRYAPHFVGGSRSSTPRDERLLALRLVDSKCVAEVGRGSQTTALPMPSPSSETHWGDMGVTIPTSYACRSLEMWTDSDGRLIFDTPSAGLLQPRDVRAFEPGSTKPHGVSSIDLARSLAPPFVWRLAAMFGAVVAIAALFVRRAPFALRVMVAWTALATLAPPLLIAYAFGLGR